MCSAHFFIFFILLISSNHCKDCLQLCFLCICPLRSLHGCPQFKAMACDHDQAHFDLQKPKFWSQLFMINSEFDFRFSGNLKILEIVFGSIMTNFELKEHDTKIVFIHPYFDQKFKQHLKLKTQSFEFYIYIYIYIYKQ